MSNNLKKMEKELRAIAKRCKDIKYTKSLLLSFLLMGMLTFSDGLNSSQVQNTQNSINKTRKELNTSISDMKSSFRQAKNENNKLLRNANLELIKLMEEGDHVVKSPWASWQFGMGYTYNGWRGTYKGLKDKAEKYPHEAPFKRGNWWQNMANKNGELYRNLGTGTAIDSSLDTNRQGLALNNYGLLDLGLLSEPVVSLKVGAGITPKAITREPVVVNPPENVNINAPALPTISTPRLQFNAPAGGALALPTADIFNIDLGAYCNDMESCGEVDEEIRNGITWNNSNPGNYQFNTLNEYAGYQFKNDPASTWASVMGETITTSQILNNLHSMGLPSTVTQFDDPTLRYSWNLIDSAAKGQWRLFKIYFDVMSSRERDPNTGAWIFKSPQLTIDNEIEINSENYDDIVNYEPSWRDFNAQPFLVGGSRIATLDNAVNGGKIINASKLKLKGPLTVGLEVQYDEIGNKNRVLENRGTITDEGEYTTDVNNEIGGIKLGQKYSDVYGSQLDLGIYNWQTWKQIAGGGTIDYSIERSGAQSSYGRNGASGGSMEVYRNRLGYLGGKVGMILTREDGEYQGVRSEYGSNPGDPSKHYPQKTVEDKYEFSNTNNIAFHGDRSIGIQIYSPYTGDETPHTNFQSSPGVWSSVANISVPPIVKVSNTGTITTEGTKSYGIKVSSGINTEHSSVTNSGTINVSGYNEVASNAAVNAANPLTPNTGSGGADGNGSSAGIAVIEDPTQTGNVRHWDTATNDYRTIAGNPTPKPISAGENVVKNMGSGKINVSGQGNSGMFLQTTFKDTFVSEGEINLQAQSPGDAPDKYNKYNSNNIGMRIATGQVVDLDTAPDAAMYAPTTSGTPTPQTSRNLNKADSRQKGINKGKINIKGGRSQFTTTVGTVTKEDGRNIGMLASGGDAVADNQGEINIGDATAGVENKDIRKNIGMATAKGNANVSTNEGAAGTRTFGKIINTKKINITKGESNTGMYIGIDGGAKGTGVSAADSEINITGGEENIGVWNEGNYISDGGKINVTGKQSVGVYSKGANSDTTLKGSITSGNGAVAMFADGNSTMKMNDLNATVKDGGLLFYSNSGGKFKFGTGVTATIEAGGNAFYSENATSLDALTTAIMERIAGTEQINLTMKPGSRLFVYEGTGAVNLSTVAPATGGRREIKKGTDVIGYATGTGYKALTAKHITFNIDTPVSLDNADDRFHAADAISSNVNINAKITNNGNAIANNMKYVVAQSQDKTTGVTAASLKITNNNAIEVTNQGGVAVAVIDFGTIDNETNATVKNTGEGGAGLVGARGSIINNKGTVTIGKNGAALYGINDLDSNVSTGTIELNNTGTINAEGENPYGVVALNKNNNPANSKITLSGSSHIDFGANNGGIAVYGQNTTINSAGRITLGSNGLGINAKGNSTLNLTGGTITSTGAGAKGIYSDNGFTNTNTSIDLQGDNSIAMFANGDITNSATIRVGNSTNASSPAIAMYGRSITNTGNVQAGEKSIGIYSNGGNASVDGILGIGSEGTGIYKIGGALNLNNGLIFNIGDGAVGVFADNATISDLRTGPTTLGTSSIGYAMNGGSFTNVSGTQFVGNDSVYVYARNGSNVVNNRAITMTGGQGVALYGKDGTNIVNDADINQGSGIENVGILITGSGSAENKAGRTITVSKSYLADENAPETGKYSIGMAGESTNGGALSLVNNGKIVVNSHRSIGMYGSGRGTTVENRGDIILDASNATASDKIEQMTGMYLNNGATGVNYGNIKTAGNYAGNPNVKGIMGVVALNGSTFENRGNIEIDANSGVGVRIEGARIKNYGRIVVNGSGAVGVQHGNAQSADGQSIGDNDTEAAKDSKVNATGATITANGGAQKYFKIDVYDPTKLPVGGVELKNIGGNLRAVVDGVPQVAQIVPPDVNGPQRDSMWTNFGVYVDTLGRTRGIEGTGFNPTGKVDVVIGAEAAQKTNQTTVKVPWETLKSVMEPLLSNTQVELNIYSGALHWFASYDNNEKSVTMVKVPYQKYAKDNNTRAYLTGVEERYKMNALDSREKALFNKLNNIGDNESILWAQAAEEMIGRQYANTQLRLYKTSEILNSEIDKLSREWDTSSKKSNKMTTFGTRGEYRTETAGIKDYTNNAYGVAYINENETLKIGESSGWYAGTVYNTYKFKDIGKSKEETLMLKAGLYRTKVFGKNRDMSWTVAGEGFVSRSEMDRKYLVVDEIFKAKGSYTGYGAAIKNELAKEFRTSERFSIRPYGSLRLEYGKFGDIKEKSGELRLAVKGDDYYSVKPEAGIEFKYRQPVAKKATFTTSLGLAYETELGKVGNINNKLRVNYTDADWYNIRGEKEDKKGNFKTDLNIGVENTRFGVTLNAGYETKGKNVKGGLGFRIIY